MVNLITNQRVKNPKWRKLCKKLLNGTKAMYKKVINRFKTTKLN